MASYIPFATHKWRKVLVKSGHPIYRRPLGNTELGFYWDSVFHGTAIAFNHAEIDADPVLEYALFSEANVVASWLRMKQRFPLLGASIEEVTNSDVIDFVVDEVTLRTRRPKDVTLTAVDDAAGAMEISERLLNGPSPLSNEYLTRLWVARQKDVAHRYHVFLPLNHSVNDGMAGATAMREFLLELSSLSEETRIPCPPIVDRLSMLLPIEDLGPAPSMNAARKKWREATAKIILNRRTARQIGGHTLPMRPKQNQGEPAFSYTVQLSLPEDVTKKILASCKALGVSFGSVLPVLSQLAISRVLHRKRGIVNKRGTPVIEDEEWEYRRIQPMHFGGPVNFRPYLNREWLANGGNSEICLAISFSYSTLPCMPSQPRASQSNSDGYPPFSSLLSPERFLYRARLSQARLKMQLRHPLSYEIHNTLTPRRLARTKAAGLVWRAKESGDLKGLSDIPSMYDQRQCVFTNGGASIGDRDAVLPREYPLATTTSTNERNVARPILHVANYTLHLRCRPSELYLGASMEQKQLKFFTFADINTYYEDDVREWMQEVCKAAKFYLARNSDIKSRL